LIDNDIFYNNEIFNSAVDFATPLGEFSIESGLLYTFKQINNEQFTLTNSEKVTSHYTYDENTYAGYIVVKRKVNQWGIQIGLRSEQFESEGKVSGMDQSINLNFFNLFPSIHIQYKKNDLLNYTLGYNRRIARPSFYHINPITTINDPLFRRVGNPALQPEFTDNLEVGLNFNAKKINVNTSLYYRHMTNLINQTFEIDDNKVTIMSFNNGGESHTVGTEINVLKDINEHFSASWSGNAYYQHASPMLDDFFYEDQYNYNFRTKLNYKTGKKFSLDVQWMYFGPSRRLNVDVEDRNFINLAVRYKILKGAGTINLRFTDIFRGNIFENERISHELLEENKWLGQTRLAILSFTYNFNKGNIKRRKGSQKSYNESGALE
ncbi:MAG: outer membrane beta-barrel family protein, partial [Fulvivirga sp.]|nr:outer membrane beta-barrel family protein [Fulvivirga sp.]